MQRFTDREAAGRALAEQLGRVLDERYGREGLLVLGLPRGGVPVAAAVSAHLGAPLDAFVVCKLGVPWQPELAMGAIAPYGTRVLNERVLHHTGVGTTQIEAAARRARSELDRRLDTYRQGRPPLALADRTVVIVDDGLATGASAHAAAVAVRTQQPERIIVAAPVGAPQTIERLAATAEIDEVVCALCPRNFVAVGQFYRRFGQVPDREVLAALAVDSK